MGLIWVYDGFYAVLCYWVLGYIYIYKVVEIRDGFGYMGRVGQRTHVMDMS